MSFTFKTSYQWDQESLGYAIPPKGQTLAVAPPPIFNGPEGFWSPEDLFLSAAETCLFLSFLFEIKRSDLRLVSYKSSATGVVERVDGGLCFTSIDIVPTLVVEGSGDEALTLLKKAHASCMVARSLKTPVRMEPNIQELAVPPG